MRTLSGIAAALAATLVTGCATTGDSDPGVTPKLLNCTGDCEIDVSFWNGPPNVVEVSNGSGKKIRWKFTRGGLFDPPGILFTDNVGPSGRAVFTNCTVSPNEKMVTCDNSGEIGKPEGYKYTVLIRFRPDIDPWVVNK